MARELYAGLHIEGIAGTTGGTKANGDLFVLDEPSFTSTVYDFVAVECDIPDPISSRLDWATGDYDLSALTAWLQATDELLLRLVPTQIETSAAVHTTFSKTAATGIKIKPSLAVDDNSHVWIGNECLYLSGRSTGTDEDTFNATRGVAHSPAIAHEVDEGVFTTPPSYRGRVVRLVVVDDLGNENVIWSGFLLNRTLNDAHTELGIETSELMASFGASPLNTTKRRFYSNGALTFNRAGNSLTGELKHPPDYERITPGNPQMMFHIGATEDTPDLIVQGRRLTTSSEAVPLGYYSEVATGINKFDGPSQLLYKNQSVRNPPRYGIARNAPIFEIIYARNNGLDTGTFQIRNNLGAVVTDVIYEPWHPASILLAFMLSTGTGDNDLEDPDSPGTFLSYDVLGEDLGLGIPEERINGASFIDIIRNDPIEIDQLILGAGGEEVNTLELLFTIAREYNYLIAPDLEGRIALRKLRTLSVESLGDMANSSVIFLPDSDGMERIGVDFNENAAVYRLRATVGRNYFDEGVSYKTNPQNLTRAELLLSAGKGDRYDYPTHDKLKVKSFVAKDLSAKARLRKETPPKLASRVTYTHTETVAGFTGTSSIAPLGTWVRLCRDPDDPSLMMVGPDGTYIDPNDDANFLICTALVTQLTLDAGNHAIDLGADLFGWRAKNLVRYIAPSGAIDAYSTSGSVTITLDATALLARDGSHGFAVNDEVVIRYANGTLWEGSIAEVKSITAISVDTITLNSAYTNTPPTGEDAYGDPIAFLELAEYDDFSNTDWAPSFLPAQWATTRYAYIADTNHELGTGNATGDVYGLS